jgi:hypothetical protein
MRLSWGRTKADAAVDASGASIDSNTRWPLDAPTGTEPKPKNLTVRSAS